MTLSTERQMTLMKINHAIALADLASLTIDEPVLTELKLELVSLRHDLSREIIPDHEMRTIRSSFDDVSKRFVAWVGASV